MLTVIFPLCTILNYTWLKRDCGTVSFEVFCSTAPCSLTDFVVIIISIVGIYSSIT